MTMTQILIAVLLCARVVSAAPPEEAPLAEARTLIDAGKAAAAIEKLHGLDDPQSKELLGVAYYHDDNHQAAIDTLTPLLEVLAEGSIERREAVQVLGLSLYLTGRLAESVPYLEQTSLWAQDNAQLSYVLANAYIQLRQNDKARAAVARLFGAVPDSAAAHLLLAQMMVRLELEEPADAELQKALALDPKMPQAHYMLGQAAIFRARYGEAVALLKRELEINPANAMALYRLGDAYVRQQKWGEAIPALQKSIWLNPYFSGPYILLGQAYTKKGQLKTAEGMLRRAVDYDPNNKSAHYLLARLLQQTDRADAAKHEFEIAERLQGEPERR